MNPFEQLAQTPANYVPLSPLTFLERAAAVFPDRTALVHGRLRQSWADSYSRCRRLAGALHKRGIGVGDVVAAMLPNTPAMFEAHFGVPMAGAVLNALNIRLDAASIAYMLDHGGARLVLVDREFAPIVRLAVAERVEPPLIVTVADPEYTGPFEPADDELDYQTLLAEGDPDFAWQPTDDEWRAIALSYTSGTTGDPKGVVTHHRGAYLNAVSNILAWHMGAHPVYLWTLPMFHCNGWCFPWTLAALAGTSVCLRAVRAEAVFRLIEQERVGYLCGAPVVLNLLKNAPDELKQGVKHRVKIMTAASAPPAAILEAMAAMNFEVTHVYGLTEVYGPAVVCEPQPHWQDLAPAEQAEQLARQGVRYPMLESLVVADPDTLQPVPADGETIGEILFRGNIVMKGYLNDPAATDKALRGGWFHSGDLAVCHPDGYVEIKDRSKDIIISGGENISSIEIEGALYRHPAVLEAAVVARPDPRWGETPCAFVELQPGQMLSEAELIAFCRGRLAGFKIPKTVLFGPLPKTSTGKIQKFLLRQRAAELDVES